MIAVLWASPNEDGLTAACARAAERGIRQAGGECVLYQLNKLNIASCRACGNGWGVCRNEHVCCQRDGFEALHEAVKRAGGLVIVTPVYWGEMAEAAKNFFDRLRRCENAWSGGKALEGRPMLAVAAAGGSGGGTVTCLAQFERLTSHLGMKMLDGIPVKRYTKDYQIAAIEAAATALAAESRV